jgi:hypothetical protein
MEFIKLWVKLLCPEIFLGPKGLKSQLKKLIISRMFSNETRKYMGVCKASAQEGKVHRLPYNIVDICVINDISVRLVENNPSLRSVLGDCVTEDSESMVYFSRFIHWVVFGCDLISSIDFFATNYKDFISTAFSSNNLITPTQKKEYLSSIIPHETKTKLTSSSPFENLRIPPSKLSFVFETKIFKHEGFACYDLALVPVYLGCSVFPMIGNEDICVPGPTEIMSL